MTCGIYIKYICDLKQQTKRNEKQTEQNMYLITNELETTEKGTMKMLDTSNVNQKCTQHMKSIKC